MSLSDDARVMRSREEVYEAGVAALRNPDTSPPPDALGKTIRIGATYPNAVGLYYGVQAVTVGGDEVEGGTVSLAVDPDAPKFLAAHLGATKPPEGTVVPLLHKDGRWTFRYG